MQKAFQVGVILTESHANYKLWALTLINLSLYLILPSI